MSDNLEDVDNKYKIVKIDTDKHKIPQRKCSLDGYLPRYPFSMELSGPSGSGKTNLLINFFTNPHMFKDYFHYILVFSPTAGELDDTYKSLKLPKENFIRKLDSNVLKKIIEQRKQQIIKQGIEKVGKTSRMIIIMDDVIADKKFLHSDDSLMLFTLLRHYLISVIILVQAYNGVPKKMRNSCNAIAVFPSLRSEVEVIKEEITPAGLNKKEFEHIINYCNKDEHSFLFINNHATKDKKIRCNIHEILTLDKMKEILKKPPAEITYEDDTKTDAVIK
ncbi:MAG: ATPase/DNA packaging protein [Bacteroidota bacterium]